MKYFSNILSLAIIFLVCSCKGNRKYEAKFVDQSIPGSSKDTVDNYVGSNLNCLNYDSTWEVVIDTFATKGGGGLTIRPKKKAPLLIKIPGIGHYDGLKIGDTAELKIVEAGKKYPPGYAGLTKGGNAVIRSREIRFGVDTNKMHRLLFTTKDSIIKNDSKD